jgi:phage internal scaffolding protein
MAVPKPGPVNAPEATPAILPDEKPTPVAGHQYIYQSDAPFVRSPYNYDRMAASNASGLRCRDPSLAVQDQRDEVDINTIVRRFGLTGMLPEDVRAPQYGDFQGINDYHGAMNAVCLANESFDALSPEVRFRFQNDPGAFVDFCLDPANKAELTKLGLVEAPVAPIVDVAAAPGSPGDVAAPPTAA